MYSFPTYLVVKSLRLLVTMLLVLLMQLIQVLLLLQQLLRICLMCLMRLLRLLLLVIEIHRTLRHMLCDIVHLGECGKTFGTLVHVTRRRLHVSGRQRGFYGRWTMVLVLI